MDTGFRIAEGLEQEDSKTVLRSTGKAETIQENIQDLLELDEGAPDFSF
jgi:hypothetical protein